MEPDQVRQRLREAIDAFNRGDLDSYLKSYSPGAVIHGLPAPFSPDLTGHREYLTSMRHGIPDMTATLQAVVVEGDLLAARMTYQGTHLGEVSGFHPTGRYVHWDAMTFRRFDDEGRTVERWLLNDRLSLLRQLGSPTA